MTAAPKSNGAFRERPHLTGRAAELRAALRSGDKLCPRLIASYLVKGWLDRGTFSVVYGAPGSGKTFLALDLALHVAAGKPWHGAKVREAATVVYLAAEGGGAFENRVMAWAGENPLPWATAAPNFHVLSLPIDLHGANDADSLVKAITDLKPCLVVVDTLARVMGKGDENAARDMGMVNANAETIIAETGAHLLLVHHSGKEIGRGARGSNSLLGAVDTEIRVAKDSGIITATSDKQRDRPSDRQFAYRLRLVQIGLDEDKDPVTSCVVEPLTKGEADECRKKGKPLKPELYKFLEALRQFRADRGTPNPAGTGWPNPGGVSVVSVDEFVEWAKGKSGATRDCDKRKAVRSAISGLHAAGVVQLNEGFMWESKQRG